MDKFLKFSKGNTFLLLLSTLILGILVYLAFRPEWRYHLDGDVWGFYYPRLTYFLQNLTFGLIPQNEYFPGAMFFFLLPGLSLFFGPNNAETYLKGLFVINIIFVLIHLVIYRKINYQSPLIFLIILLFAGPIFLFRHELYVSLVVVAALLLWKSNYKKLSLLTLGIATSIKIYPVLLLPYFLILEKHKIKDLISDLLYFALGLGLFPMIYLMFGSSQADIIEPLTINSIKPVHVESVFGTLLTIIPKISFGYWALGKGANGIYGIAPEFIYLPLFFYNYFWVLPLSIFYFYIYKKHKDKFRFEFIFLIIILYEIFSKILTGQYLFWFIPIFPLFWKSKIQYKLFLSFLLIILIVFLTQIVYPLHYNELLGIFYTLGTEEKYFYFLALRNVLLVTLFAVVFKYVSDEKN